MKKIYIAPQAEIETLGLKSTILADETLGYAKYSNTSKWVHTNEAGFEEEGNSEIIISSSHNLWEE